MATSLAKYASTAFPFPKDDINPADKNEEWGRKWCEAMYAQWKQNKTAVPFSYIDEIRSLRELADGRQNILQYQKILLDESEDNGDMKGYMNINWDVFSVMPKFLRVVEGMMEQTDHQVVATAVDPSSTEEKETAKLDMTYRMKFKEALQYIDKNLGIDRSGDYVPDTMEELNLYDGAGGFKLAKETELEQGLDYSFYISDWREVKKKVIRDLCVINCACTKDLTDQYVKKVKSRYVDPAYFVGQYSRHADHKNMEYGGEIIQVLISDIRKLCPGIKEEELLRLASEYSGVGTNVTQDILSYNESTKSANYDSYLVDVMDSEWFSVNSKYRTTRLTSYGTKLSYDEEYGKVYNTEKKKTEKYDIKVVYKCKWIVGTEHPYDFGLQYDVPRPGKKEVSLSYHFYKLPYRSLVSLSEAHLHSMAMTYFKLQNAIAMASPPGIAIEFTALQNMTLGKNKMQPLDLLKIKRQTGDLIYKATTHRGLTNTPGSYKPIQELAGGIGNQLVEFLKVFEFETNAIRDLTGINQIADASAPNPEMSVGGSELSLAATNNALRPIYSAYIDIKEKTAKNMALRMQLLIKHDKEAYAGYMPVIGTIGVKVISVGADVVDANYYIKYEAKPTNERKNSIKDAAIKAMNPDRDGIIGIELPDFLMIERLLESGNLKYAEAYLNYKTKKNKERQLNLQRENMKLDSEREQSAIKLKSELVTSEEKIKTDEQIRLYDAKKSIDEKFAQLEHERKKELLGLQSTLGIVEKTVETESAVSA